MSKNGSGCRSRRCRWQVILVTKIIACFEDGLFINGIVDQMHNQLGKDIDDSGVGVW
jgi:hypothetical protein